MSVVIETTLGDITVDLFLADRPRACLNFLKLCKIKYYNFNLFHTISRGFIAQTGDPTGSRKGGESFYGVLDGTEKRYFESENEPRIKHTKMGLISFVGNEERMIGSQFFITLGEDLTYLDQKHCVFGEVVEGFDILEIINEVICDTDDRPYQDVRITHTVILDDPYPDPKRLKVPSRSPSPSAERLQGGRIAPDEDVDETEGKNAHEVAELQAEREAKARATILEMVGDLPDAEMAPPENVLFVCKLNPVTTDDDLEIIFNRFGKIVSCEVIRDRKTGDSLQYAFIEFNERKACEDAYFKMDNILIDDRRIHVDFSQSVSKVTWNGKGRGVTHYDDKGVKTTQGNRDIGKGDYKIQFKPNKNFPPHSPKNDRRDQNKYSNKRDTSTSALSKSYKQKDERPRSRSPRMNSYNQNGLKTKNGKSQKEKFHSPKSSFRKESSSRRETNREKKYRSRSRSPNSIRERKYRSRSRSPRRRRDDRREAESYRDRIHSRRDDLARQKYEYNRRQNMSQMSDRDFKYSRYDRSGQSSSKYPTKDHNAERYNSKMLDRQTRDKTKYSKEENKSSRPQSKGKKSDSDREFSDSEIKEKKIKKKNSSHTSDIEKKSQQQKKQRESTDEESDSSESEVEKLKSKKRKKKSSSDSSSSSSDESTRKKKKKKKRKTSESSSSSEDSDSSESVSSSESEDKKRKKKKKMKKRTKTSSESSSENDKSKSKNKKKKRKH